MHNSVAIDAIEKKLTQNRLTGLLEAFVICYSLGDRLNRLKKQENRDDVLMTVYGVVPEGLDAQIFKVQELSHQIANALKLLFRNSLEEFSKQPHNSKKINAGKNYDLSIERYCNMICVIDRAIHQFIKQRASEASYTLLRAYQNAFAKNLFEVLGEKNLTVHWEATDCFSDGDYEACKSVCQDYIDGSAKVDAFFVGELGERYSKDLEQAQAVSSFSDLFSEADSMDELLDFQESIEISLFKIRSSINETGYNEKLKLALLALLNKVNKASFEMFQGQYGIQKYFLSTRQIRIGLGRNISEIITNNERGSFEQTVSDMGELLEKEECLDQLSKLCHEQASYYSNFIEQQLPNTVVFSGLIRFYDCYVTKFTELSREVKLVVLVKPVAIKVREVADNYQSQLNSIAQDPDFSAQVRRYSDAYKNLRSSPYSAVNFS
jgi:hypothetical protein